MIFTPRHGTRRLELNVSPADRAAFDTLPPGESDQTVTVTDVDTGRRYVVARADCGQLCYCDATVRLSLLSTG